MKILFDTNTVIGYLTNGFNNEEKTMIETVLEKHECGISVKSAADIHYYLKESFDDKKTKELIDILNGNFEILDISDDSDTNVSGSNRECYENEIMIATAVSNDYDCIVTGNLENFRKSPIRIISIKELSDIIR